MALEVEWYDFVCFGIVGVALIGALWVLWKKETVSRRQYDSRYESLLVARPDHEVDATSLPKGHVSAAQLWTSAWRGLNPLWLLATRFTSFLVMAVLLTWDALKNGSAIFYYYSEWTFTLVMIYFALMGFMHTMNLAFLLVDTALNDLPFPWFRMAYFVLWSCAYIIFLWVAHVCGLSWWPYPFLELDNPWAPLWYFFLAAFHIPCYWLYVLIVKAKDKILAKLFQDAYLRP